MVPSGWTTQVTQPLLETSVTTDDEGPIHISCHCTGHNLGKCGEDLTDVPMIGTINDEDLDEVCPLCDLVWELQIDPHCCCHCDWC